LSRNAVHNWVEKRGKGFAHDEEIETEVRMWLRQQSKDFYAAGFDALVKRWECVSMLVDDMSRSKCSFQVRMSHVLRFISICDLFTDSPSYHIFKGDPHHLNLVMWEGDFG
jgi:hypothetical protein